MDAYVIRTKRENSNKSKKLEKKKYLKQVKIEALPRVVVVEDIERVAAILENENDAVIIKKALEELKDIKPSKEILLRTKIGHRVNKLRANENAAVRKVASEVFKDWRKFYKDMRYRPSIEVRCDAKTELLRMKARKLLADGLRLKVTDSLSELIEREVFKNTKRKTNHIYKRSIRKLCFKLKCDDTRSDLVSGKIPVDCFCKEIL